MKKKVNELTHEECLKAFLQPCDVYIVETAGFIDLETRFKRLEQSGYVANFFSSMFDTDDEREIYLSDETEIFASDDEDTVRLKLIKQAKLREEIMKSKLGDLAEADDDEGRKDEGGSSESKSPSQDTQTKV